MGYNCIACGGACKEVSKGGKTVYVCKWCGKMMEEEDFRRAEKDKADSARRQSSSKDSYSATSSRDYASTETLRPANDAVDYYSASVAAGARRILSGEELFEKAIPSVVEIFVENVDSSAAASGFVVSSRGLVLTNAHAVLDEYGKLFDKIFVRSGEQYYSAFPLALGEPRANQPHDTFDLCLLYVDGFVGAPATDFADVSLVKNGQKVYLIGNSLGEGTCITSGIISDKDRHVGGLSYPYIMTDAAANPGNSGGPLFSEYGDVIGVLVAGISSAKGMNYAIPANVAEKFLTHVINNTNIKDLDLGELNRYKNLGMASTYAASTDTVFDGVRLILDIIEYVMGLFA